MTENLKPTSKVIQISTTALDGREFLTVLCEDGSIWERWKSCWECILEAPKPTAPIIPMPNSRWKKDGWEFTVSSIFSEQDRIMVRYCDGKEIYEEELEIFLKLYEPLEADNAK